MDTRPQFDQQNGYIIDDSIYPIGKDTDGVSSPTKELHDVVLSLILELDRVARKNGIPYALGFGSALGLHNYHGFIPWDDDADIVIDYFDIPRLVEALKRDLGPNFAFDAYEKDKRYNVLIPTMKLRRTDTYLREKNFMTLPNRCGSGEGVYIDICAFHGVPSDPKEHYKLIKYAKRRMPLYVTLDGFLRIHPYGLKKKLKAFEQDIALRYKDSPMVSQSVIIPWQDWSDEISRLAFPREVIFPFREYEFEGHRVFSFNDVKAFARLRYGEKSLRVWNGEKWCDPYPESRRRTRHISAFNLRHKVK